eukprot:gene15022-biopygen23155
MFYSWGGHTVSMQVPAKFTTPVCHAHGKEAGASTEKEGWHPDYGFPYHECVTLSLEKMGLGETKMDAGRTRTAR